MMHTILLLLAVHGLSIFTGADESNRQAPEFPLVDETRWFNSSPLKMADLRGKVIMLEVWTFM